MKVVAGQHYMRRRDKVLVVVDKVSGSNTHYTTLSELTTHNVTTSWFRQGFRLPTPEELAKHGLTPDGQKKT